MHSLFQFSVFSYFGYFGQKSSLKPFARTQQQHLILLTSVSFPAQSCAPSAKSVNTPCKYTQPYYM